MQLLNSFIKSFPILRLFDGYKKAANGSFKKKETEEKGLYEAEHETVDGSTEG